MSSIGMNMRIVCRGERDSETDKMLKSFFIWSSVSILHVFKKKKKIITAKFVQQTGEHLYEHNQHELRGTHFTS